MLIAQDFIDEQRLLIDNESMAQSKQSRYTEPELLAYLQSAYRIIQEDKPFFRKSIDIVAISEQKEYMIPYEILDGISLKIDKQESTKLDIESIFTKDNKYENYYATELNTIFINNSLEENTNILFTFYRIKELKSLDAQILLPTHFHEALRLLFLSRVFEKLPTRNERNLSIHYLKRYEKKLIQVTKNTKQKYRGVRSTYQKI